MGKLRSEQPRHRDAIDELLADVEAAFTGPSFWAPFTARCHASGITRLSDWLNSTGRSSPTSSAGAHRAGRGPRTSR